MKVYKTENIRNIVLLGHKGCGKTSLVEKMAYSSGVIKKLGDVNEGTTISDYDNEEIKRHFSIKTSIVPIIWNDTKINVMDTPGEFEFIGEMESTVSVADGAIILVSVKKGIQAGTLRAWEICERYNIPKMFYLTNIEENSSCEDLLKSLKEKFKQNIEVFNGSNINNFLHAILNKFPSSKERKISGMIAGKEELFEADYDENKAVTAKVFKTLYDEEKIDEKISFVKVCSGILKKNDTLYNADKESDEKISEIYIIIGKEKFEVEELRAGDIGAVRNLEKTETSDTLSTKENPVIYQRIEFSEPDIYKNVDFMDKSKRDSCRWIEEFFKLFDEVLKEDKTLKLEEKCRYMVLYGMGRLHLELAINKVFARHKEEIKVSQPKMPYKEMIRKKAELCGRHIRQSGSPSRVGGVTIVFENTGNFEESYQFEENIVEENIRDKLEEFVGDIEEGVESITLWGILAEYPIVGLKATLVDGIYHACDSCGMAYFMATMKAAHMGCEKLDMAILEPFVKLYVTIPSKYENIVIEDLKKKNGIIIDIKNIEDNKRKIICEISKVKLYEYSIVLRSLTEEYGKFSYEFLRYEQVSKEVQDKLVEEFKEKQNND